MKTTFAVAALLALTGCAGQVYTSDPGDDGSLVDVAPQTVHTTCNHPKYLTDGSSEWYAWQDYETLPSQIEVVASHGQGNAPSEGSVTLEHWISGTRVIVKCGNETGAPLFWYSGWVDVTFTSK